MRRLKHLNIYYRDNVLNIKENNSLSSIPNLSKFDSDKELLELVDQKKINLLITNYNFDTLKKVRQKDSNLQILAVSNELNKEHLLQSLELQHIKFIESLTSIISLQESLKACAKNLDSNTSNIIKLKNDFTFDSYNNTLFYKNEIVQLSKKETQFLNLLIENVNRALTYEEINEKIWSGSMSQDALRSIVKELRKKVYKELIKNVSGVGYRLDLI